MREAFQDAGFRVEELNDPVANLPYLRSATGGMPFDVRPGNRSAIGTDRYVDVGLITVFQVQGELPLEIVNRWNATRRFGRVQISPPFLALHLDISVAGGVTHRFLRTQLELWDHLIQQLISYLRDELQKLPAAGSAVSADQNATPEMIRSSFELPADA
nr:YbjN domain-containing protein [Afipia massiliensis]